MKHEADLAEVEGHVQNSLATNGKHLSPSGSPLYNSVNSQDSVENFEICRMRCETLNVIVHKGLWGSAHQEQRPSGLVFFPGYTYPEKCPSASRPRNWGSRGTQNEPQSYPKSSSSKSFLSLE